MGEQDDPQLRLGLVELANAAFGVQLDSERDRGPQEDTLGRGLRNELVVRLQPRACRSSTGSVTTPRLLMVTVAFMNTAWQRSRIAERPLGWSGTAAPPPRGVAPGSPWPILARNVRAAPMAVDAHSRMHSQMEAEMTTATMSEPRTTGTTTMMAMVYKGPGSKAWEAVARPAVAQPTDAVVRIVKTTICGTDLHILKGDVPTVAEGRILGHEGVGIVEEVGEAVGIPATFDICQNIVRPGGHIANVGVHGKSVDLQLQKLWIQNITLTTGLVNTNTTPMLLKTVAAKKLRPAELITHRFTFDQFLEAYEVFANAAKEKAMKVIVANG